MKPEAVTPPAGAAGPPRADALWSDALTAVQLLSQPAHRLGGIWLRAPHGPVREAWLQALGAQAPKLVRAPGSVDTPRWLGGLDLAATLQTGRLEEQPGLLRQADGGLLCLPMAERLDLALASSLCQTLDRAGVDRGGRLEPTRFGVVALDESLEDEAPVAPALRERLGLWIDLRGVPPASVKSLAHRRPPPAAGPAPVAGESVLQSLCGTALALGIDSLRVPALALEVACAHARLHDRDHVADEDLLYACRTVLAPRARQWPQQADDGSSPQDEDATAPERDGEDTPEPHASDAAEPPHPSLEATPPHQDTKGSCPPAADAEALQAMMVAAAAARLPPDLLLRLSMGTAPSRGARQGTSGQSRLGAQRGRPLPPRPARPGGQARLHLLATLRAAAPRQRLRGRTDPTQRLRIRAEDFHVHRAEQRSASCLILAVDASGSAALHRLAEAKGAVQLLLEQSYARRDSVCVIGFRGAQAQLLLPATRSLVRARRALTGLPGGGGTPLASALHLAHEQAALLQRQGVTPILVVLSDGRANVTLQGLGGRAQAQSDAAHWALAWQATGHAGLWIDTAPQPEALARQLASQLGARYLPMPHMQSQRLAQALREARAPL